MKAKRGRKSLPFVKNMETNYGRKKKITFSNCFIGYKEEVEEEEEEEKEDYDNFYDDYYCYFCEQCLYSKN